MIRDLDDKTLLVLEKIQPFISYVEVVEGMTLFEAIYMAIEVDIHSLWGEIDSLILWKFLNGFSYYGNEIQYLVDSFRVLQQSGKIHDFNYVNRKGNSMAYELATHTQKHV